MSKNGYNFIAERHSERDKSGQPTCACCSVMIIIVLVLIGVIAIGFLATLAITKCFGDEHCAVISLVEKVILQRS